MLSRVIAAAQIFLITFQSLPSAAADLRCQSVLSVRLSEKNTLFIPDSAKNKFSDVAYKLSLERLRDRSLPEVIDFFTDQSEVRSISAEEVIAALDVLVPQERPLFDILQHFPKIRVDEVELSQFFRDPTMIDDLRGRIEKKKKLSFRSHLEEIILELATRFHHLSLMSFGHKTLFSNPIFSRQAIVEIDRYLAGVLDSLRRVNDSIRFQYKSTFSDRVIIRELAYIFGLKWAHPLARYVPKAEDLKRALNDPIAHRRVLAYKLAPAVSIHWLSTHIIWASMAFFMIYMPFQIAQALESVGTVGALTDAIKEMGTEHSQTAMKESYQHHLKEGYERQIIKYKEREEELVNILKQNPNNAEVKDELDNIKKMIGYLQDRLNSLNLSS